MKKENRRLRKLSKRAISVPKLRKVKGGNGITRRVEGD